MQQQLRRLHKVVRIATDTVKDFFVTGPTSTRVCPICKKHVRIFWPYGVMLRPGAQCPHCRALERHRTLWLYLESCDLLRKDGLTLLHFGPEPTFLSRFSAMQNIDYWPVDINPNLPGIRRTADITNLPFEDESMDLILCNHVMEHIEDEAKALSELHRVLRKDGIAIINAPVDESREATFENPAYNTPELRLKYFGQHDHVRIYGRDYPQRLAKVFQVEVLEPNRRLTPQQQKDYSVWEGDKIYVCRK